MKLTALNPSELLSAAGLRPKKSLGQNFLTDPNILQRITDAAEIGRDDTVLEIGPGLGSLTRHLAMAAGAVLAVELDGGLIPILENVLADYPNVTVVHGDILKVNLERWLGGRPYIAAANIPYYITSAVIRRLLSGSTKPTRLLFTMQKEVAERICAGPGDMSLLALSVQVFGHPEQALRIPAGAFYPPPKVDSACLRVDLYKTPLIPETSLDTFFHLAKAGFSQKRKTLRNSLAGGLRLPPEQAASLILAAGIDPQRRAEALGLQDWAKLTEVYIDRNNQQPA